MDELSIPCTNAHCQHQCRVTCFVALKTLQCPRCQASLAHQSIALSAHQLVHLLALSSNSNHSNDTTIHINYGMLASCLLGSQNNNANDNNNKASPLPMTGIQKHVLGSNDALPLVKENAMNATVSETGANERAALSDENDHAAVSGATNATAVANSSITPPWTCHHCTLENDDTTKICGACERRRPSQRNMAMMEIVPWNQPVPFLQHDLEDGTNALLSHPILYQRQQDCPPPNLLQLQAVQNEMLRYFLEDPDLTSCCSTDSLPPMFAAPPICVKPGYYKVHLASNFVVEHFSNQLPSGWQIKERAKRKAILFVNTKGGRCDTHYDMDTSVLLVLSGQKELLVAPPGTDLRTRRILSSERTYHHSTILDGLDPFEETPEGRERFGFTPQIQSMKVWDALLLPKSWCHCIESKAGTVAVSFQVESASLNSSSSGVGGGTKKAAKLQQTKKRPCDFTAPAGNVDCGRGEKRQRGERSPTLEEEANNTSRINTAYHGNHDRALGDASFDEAIIDDSIPTLDGDGAHAVVNSEEVSLDIPDVIASANEAIRINNLDRHVTAMEVRRPLLEPSGDVSNDNDISETITPASLKYEATNDDSSVVSRRPKRQVFSCGIPGCRGNFHHTGEMWICVRPSDMFVPKENPMHLICKKCAPLEDGPTDYDDFIYMKGSITDYKQLVSGKKQAKLLGSTKHEN